MKSKACLGFFDFTILCLFVEIPQKDAYQEENKKCTEIIEDQQGQIASLIKSRQKAEQKVADLGSVVSY